MYTLFTIQSIKYLPISPPTAPYSVLTTSLLLEADQISGWHLSRNGPSQQLAGDHILCICQATWQSWVLKAFLKVLRRSMGLSSLPTPPTRSNAWLPLPGPLYSSIQEAPMSTYCVLWVLGRWRGITYLPMPFVENTSPVIKNHDEKSTQVLSCLSTQLTCVKHTA